MNFKLVLVLVTIACQIEGHPSPKLSPESEAKLAAFREMLAASEGPAGGTGKAGNGPAGGGNQATSDGPESGDPATNATSNIVTQSPVTGYTPTWSPIDGHTIDTNEAADIVDADTLADMVGDTLVGGDKATGDDPESGDAPTNEGPGGEDTPTNDGPEVGETPTNDGTEDGGSDAGDGGTNAGDDTDGSAKDEAVSVNGMLGKLMVSIKELGKEEPIKMVLDVRNP